MSGRAAATYLASPRRISEVRWTDWYTRLPAAATRFPFSLSLTPFLVSLRLPLSLSPSFFYSRAALLRPSRSHAHTHAHTPLARFSARLPQIFISGSTANSGRTGRSARDRPGFLTVLTASSPQAATAAAVVSCIIVYTRDVCAPGQHPPSRRDDACLNLNTLWQRRGEAVPSARVTPSESPSSHLLFATVIIIVVVVVVATREKYISRKTLARSCCVHL